MKKPNTSSRTKTAGYILLVVAATILFITTSGLLSLLFFRDEFTENVQAEGFCKWAGLITFLLAVALIIIGRDKNEDGSLVNRLLLPHYFKYVGYVYLALVILYATTDRYGYRRSTTVSWHREVMLPSDQTGLTDEQQKIYNDMKAGGRVEHSSSIIITPLTMILPVGLLFLAFARERVEDELISKYRTQSLQLAVLLLFFMILYQKFYVPEIETVILTNPKGVAYFDVPGKAWRADVLINVILIFSILRMEYLLRLKPLFTKNAGAI
ncbi:hypothetical protein [Mucilaginibacter myungsuensis]|uniref:Uncharacterized protein n=1 Tax=Mucilaginibacter myungsuensis TaxID=649104 RepID=A0A929L3J2_9SPHI|nr:hypothetical protein [Mucilaginibacter myungsuensis]MBE9663390.1 hypothetical protein [Mucilaginibacter myungsuensis]MDN3600127.1 hypothetical protein [Mucilaginibacter myungsuensis]